MGNLLQDIKFGIRMLVKNRWFTLIAVATLSLGIGVNTAVFSVVNGVLLNPLPFPQPNQLLALFENTPDFKEASISYPNFLDWKRMNSTLASIAAYRSDSANLTGSGEARQVNVEMVSADFFTILGVRPVLGRTFTADEDRPGAAPVVLLSERFWKSKFGSSPQVLGTTITMDGKGYTILGVIPGNLHHRLQNDQPINDIYIPVGIFGDPQFQKREKHEGLDAIARMKPGVTVQQVRAEMAGIARTLAAEYPDADKNAGITVMPMKEQLTGDVRPFLLILLGAVGFVLLIACVNVANLQLARSAGRAREFAIRAAMGASQRRVVRQLLTESILLGLAGGAIGLVLAQWGTHAALSVLPEALPRAEGVGIDGRVLLFTLAASILAGVVFGLAPALKTAQPNVQEILKEGDRGVSGSKHRAQGVFIVMETAMALILLVGAGLMIRSLVDLWRVNPGFDPRNVLTFNVSLSSSQGVNPATTRSALRQAESTIQTVPGVEAVSITGGALPMQGDTELPFWVEGRPKPANTSEMKPTLIYFSDPGYLKAMGIHLERGRFMEPSDDENSQKVVVIDDKFAQEFFPGQDPIGKQINMEIVKMHLQVVGIVGHVKHWGLDTDASNTIQAQAYIPLLQAPDQFFVGPASAMIVVRTKVAPATMTEPIRKALEGLNSQDVMYGAQTMESIISDSLAARRFSMILLGVFAALALVLSSIGIFGVISYVVSQRTHEIGIRIALGAQRRDVLQLMLGDGMKMALIGVAIGAAIALFATRLMTNILFGVSPNDPLTFAGVAVILSGVALLACYLPARRAMRVDPMVALRYE
jgi:predicted permease